MAPNACPEDSTRFGSCSRSLDTKLRLGLRLHVQLDELAEIMDGALEHVIQPLVNEYQAELLAALAD